MFSGYAGWGEVGVLLLGDRSLSGRSGWIEYQWDGREGRTPGRKDLSRETKMDKHSASAARQPMSTGDMSIADYPFSSSHSRSTTH